eukprot:scaffold5161_cov33-Phaeocystis_antarctica.AAC.1
MGAAAHLFERGALESGALQHGPDEPRHLGWAGGGRPVRKAQDVARKVLKGAAGKGRLPLDL